MAVHGVLVQTEQEVQLVAVGEHLLVADAKGEEDVPTADDGLVGVVGAEVQPTTDDYASENVAGCGNTLASLTANAHCEIVRAQSHRYAPAITPRQEFVAGAVLLLHPVCIQGQVAVCGLSIPLLTSPDKQFDEMRKNKCLTGRKLYEPIPHPARVRDTNCVPPGPAPRAPPPSASLKETGERERSTPVRGSSPPASGSWTVLPATR